MDNVLSPLRLQLEWGADEALDLNPINRLLPLQIQPPESRPIPLPQPVAATGSKKGTPNEQAVALAAQATTLQALRTVLAGFDGCALRDTASNLVFAEGDPASSTLIIGEPPGREEDRSGHPFAGQEGHLLDQMLLSIGLTRAELMLTPLLPWRPPGGRPPSAGEIAICQPFLHRLIVLLKPNRIVLFGGSAARVILSQAHNRRRTPHGWIEAPIPGTHETIPVMALPAVADMLKNPPLRRDAWAGLRLLRRALDEAQTQT